MNKFIKNLTVGSRVGYAFFGEKNIGTVERIGLTKISLCETSRKFNKSNGKHAFGQIFELTESLEIEINECTERDYAMYEIEDILENKNAAQLKEILEILKVKYGGDE